MAKIKEKTKRIVRVDFTNQEAGKYFTDSLLSVGIKNPDAHTDEEKRILLELQKQKLSYRVIPFSAMSFTQKMEVMSQVMEIMHHMVIYEIEDGVL